MLEELLAEDVDHGWRSEAACLTEDPELFFPEGESERYRGQIEAAVEVCRSCGVADACLAFAIETEQRTGIWGGTTAQERRGLEVVAGQVRRVAPLGPAAASDLLRAAG